MKTTPTPWKVDGDDLWHFGISYNDTRDPHLYTGVSVNPGLRESPIAHGNMELIVRAVNAHDDLLAAAELIYRKLESSTESVTGLDAAQLKAAINKARNG